MFRRFDQSAVWLLSSLLLVGCGDGLGRVSGRLMLDGQPLAGDAQTQVTVMFYPEAGGAPASGMVDEDGEYSVATGASPGIAPGKYVVIIAATKSSASAPNVPPTKKLITPEKYADPKRSGLTADVQPGRNTFDFALDSKT